MIPIEGLVVATRPGAVTIELDNGLRIDCLVARKYRYGERIRIIYDYATKKVKTILKENEELTDTLQISPLVKEPVIEECPLAFKFAPLSLS